MYELNGKLKSLKPYDPGMAQDMIHLDANESFLPLPEELLEEGAGLLRKLPFNRYPDPAARELCEAFAARYGVPAADVTAGNGSDELISVLFTGFLEKGDAFATIEPDFSMYALNGQLQEARHVRLYKEDFCIDIDRVIETCNRENVRLLIFSNPCNPTSVVCPKEDMRVLIKGVRGLVVLDEAYMDFSDQSLLPEFAEYDNLVILRTCSKAFGMAALRLGFAVAGEKLTQALRAVKSPYNVNTLSQKLGAMVLRGGNFLDSALEKIIASRDELCRGLGELEARFPGRFRMLKSDTNFAALVMEDPESARRSLWEQGVSVRCSGGLLRVTCGTEEENKIFLAAFRCYWETK